MAGHDIPRNRYAVQKHSFVIFHKMVQAAHDVEIWLLLACRQKHLNVNAHKHWRALYLVLGRICKDPASSFALLL